MPKKHLPKKRKTRVKALKVLTVNTPITAERLARTAEFSRLIMPPAPPIAGYHVQPEFEEHFPRSRREPFLAIDSERKFQEALIAATGTGRPKPLESYLLYIEDYVSQMRKELTRIWGPTSQTRALETLRKITALGVAAMEEHGAPKRDAREAAGYIEQALRSARSRRMIRLAYILAIALLLGGCVQARINAYYNPKPAEPCQVPIIVDGVQRDCVSREHAKQILEDLTK